MQDIRDFPDDKDILAVINSIRHDVSDAAGYAVRGQYGFKYLSKNFSGSIYVRLHAHNDKANPAKIKFTAISGSIVARFITSIIVASFFGNNP